MDTLRFCTAIPQRFKLSELFDIADNGKEQIDEEYVLKAVVCFLGAHYMTYIKVKEDGPQSIPIWKLYDDYKHVQIYSSWREILEKILEFGTLPTVLIYEKVTIQNNDFDMLDTVNVDELKQLDNRAYSLQKFIDQYENAEAQAQIKQNSAIDQPEEEKVQAGVVPDPKAVAMVRANSKSQSQILQELYQIKKKYKNYDIYIFECIRCSLFMMLHQQYCPHCNRKNTYYDSSLKLNQQIEVDVTKVLDQI